MRGFVGKRFLIQSGCMHRSLVYHSAKMPGCPRPHRPALLLSGGTPVPLHKMQHYQERVCLQPKTHSQQDAPSTCVSSESIEGQEDFLLITFFPLLMFGNIP